MVSTFPILGGVPYSTEKMLVILDLPPGTLTQRTLIYAVRTHPERPQSTDGQLREELSEEAERHSGYQARIRLQGHHQWGSRFPRIAALLPRGLTASEVCAESWPGEGLLAAAIECVRCWRHFVGPLARRPIRPAVLRLRHETRLQRHLVRHRHLRRPELTIRKRRGAAPPPARPAMPGHGWTHPPWRRQLDSGPSRPKMTTEGHLAGNRPGPFPHRRPQSCLAMPQLPRIAVGTIQPDANAQPDRSGG